MMKIVSLLLLALKHASPSIIMSRFISSSPPNLDILDLYYDFLFSNLTSVEPILVDKVSSASECSLMCLLNNQFRCNAFSYSTENQSCLLMPMLNSENISSSSDLFRRIPDCPGSFVYLPSYNKCYKWMVGSFNWSIARKLCNGVNSHPLVTDNPLELEATVAFRSLPYGEAAVDYSCVTQNLFTWISATMIKPNKMPFVWKPFLMKDGSEPYLPIDFISWGRNQPDNEGRHEYCAELQHDLSVNDLSCKTLRCVICEIDV